MSRPAKAVNTQSRHNTKLERSNRAARENTLKGATDKITPPPYLNETQNLIFRLIVQELEPSGILGNLDIFILSQCSIAIDRLQTIETMINSDSSLLCNNSLMASKDKYSRDLYRCCNELSLSPQSRAKMAGINIQTEKEKKDPLLMVLRGGNADDKALSGV